MTYFGPMWYQKWPDNLAHRGRFSHTHESTHNVPVNQVSWSHIKNFLRNWPKTSEIPIFIYFFFLIKDPLKKKKFYYHKFLGDIVHIQAKYRKDLMKPGGAYSIWKKKVARQMDRRTARHRKSFADSVSGGAKKWHFAMKNKEIPSLCTSKQWTVFQVKCIKPNTLNLV